MTVMERNKIYKWMGLTSGITCETRMCSVGVLLKYGSCARLTIRFELTHHSLHSFCIRQPTYDYRHTQYTYNCSNRRCSFVCCIHLLRGSFYGAVQWLDVSRRIDWKWFGRRCLWNNWPISSNIWLDSLRKNTTIIRWDMWWTDADANKASLK
jgi:hypothetical protein